MDPLAKVKALLGSLPMDEQEELHAYLGALLEPAEVEREEPLVATVRSGSGTVSYRQERVRCGKASCACRRGALHGPYVYKYWREGGRLRKAYVGRAEGGRVSGASAPLKAGDARGVVRRP